MSEFLYLYRGGVHGASPEQMQQSMQKWMAWFKQLERPHVTHPCIPSKTPAR